MNDLLFNVIAIAATTGFLLGIISGWLPLILVSILLAGLVFWVLPKIR
jgi:hypothetical protein